MMSHSVTHLSPAHHSQPPVSNVTGD